MKKIFYLLLVLTIISCSQKKKVVIQYDDLSKLKKDSYLQIDQLVIPHTFSAKAIRYNLALPLEYVNTFDSNSNNAPMTKTNKVMVLEKLKLILALKKEYQFDSALHINFSEKLIFYRKDGKPVKIKTSKNYPASITYRD